MRLETGKWFLIFCWGKTDKVGHEPYYFQIFNFLSKDIRFVGRDHFWYDGPHKTIGFWFFNIAWSTQWTKWKDEDEE